MKKFYFSKAYLTYLSFLTFGFSVTLLFETCSNNFKAASKDIVPFYVVAAICPLALKRIERDQDLEEKMTLFLGAVRLKEDGKFLEECWEKGFGSSNDGERKNM
jgi:hypothetical protein